MKVLYLIKLLCLSLLLSYKFSWRYHVHYWFQLPLIWEWLQNHYLRFSLYSLFQMYFQIPWGVLFWPFLFSGDLLSPTGLLTPRHLISTFSAQIAKSACLVRMPSELWRPVSSCLLGHLCLDVREARQMQHLQICNLPRSPLSHNENLGKWPQNAQAG